MLHHYHHYYHTAKRHLDRRIYYLADSLIDFSDTLFPDTQTDETLVCLLIFYIVTALFLLYVLYTLVPVFRRELRARREMIRTERMNQPSWMAEGGMGGRDGCADADANVSANAYASPYKFTDSNSNANGSLKHRRRPCLDLWNGFKTNNNNPDPRAASSKRAVQPEMSSMFVDRMSSNAALRMIGKTRASSESSYDSMDALEAQDSIALRKQKKLGDYGTLKDTASTGNTERIKKDSRQGYSMGAMSEFAIKMTRWIDGTNGREGALLPVAR